MLDLITRVTHFDRIPHVIFYTLKFDLALVRLALVYNCTVAAGHIDLYFAGVIRSPFYKAVGAGHTSQSGHCEF